MSRRLPGAALTILLVTGCDAPPCATDDCAGDGDREGDGDGDGEGEGEDEDDALSFAPALCDFGAVTVGGTGECVVTIQNPGRTEVMLSRLGLADDSGVFWPGDATPVPLPIRPGERVTIRLLARPTAIGSVRDTFVAEDRAGDVVLAVPLRVQAIAGPTSLVVQMTHDTAGSDVDLHLLRNDGDWCGVDDCHAGNPTPDWGPGSPRFSDTLTELIVIEDVVDGRYTVGVDHVVGTTQVVVRVFFAGSLQHEATLGLDSGQWLPVRLDVTHGTPAITRLDDVTPQVGACLQD